MAQNLNQSVLLLMRFICLNQIMSIVWRLPVLAFAFFSVTASASFVSDTKIHQLYTENKSEIDNVYSVVKDADGFLWLGTDNGLKRYDGYGFKHFSLDLSNPDSLGTTLAITLLLQRDGTFWAGGRNLNRFNPETETFTRYEVSGGGLIYAMEEDTNGVIWIGGQGFGLQGFNPKSGEVEKKFAALDVENENTKYINGLTLGHKKNILWVATAGGVFRLNTQTYDIKKYSLPWGFAEDSDGVKGLAVAPNGSIWVATQKGLVVINQETETHRVYQYEHGKDGGIGTNSIWSVFVDSKEQIWIGTDKSGVYRYLPKQDSFMHYPALPSDEHAFPAASINRIYEDDNGSLWFAVRKFGVRRISESLEKFKTLQHSTNPNSLAFNNVLDLHEDKSGKIWIATDGGGLDVYNPKNKTFKHFVNDPKNRSSLSSNSVISLAEIDGHVWAGTWAGGINIYNTKTDAFSHITSAQNEGGENRLSNNNIFNLDADANGGIWLSVWRNGLQYYLPETKAFSSYPPSQSGLAQTIYNDSVNDVIVTLGNYLWIGGYLGLERLNLNTHKSKRFYADEIQAVNDFLLDGTQLWIGTSTGLFRLDTESLTIVKYTAENGLADSYIVSIEMARDGDLWLGTRSGLSHFVIAENRFENFDDRDGLTARQFNVYSHITAQDGTMYFGGPKGINIFHPESLPLNRKIPNIVLTDFELLHIAEDGDNQAFYQESLNKTKSVSLPYFNRDMAFEFSALNFISPSKNQYKYQLEGHDKNWITVDSTRRRVRYTNLDPGKYRFRVLGSNNDGVWNTEGLTVNIVILTPWWMTWWARALGIIVVGLLIYAFIFWRLQANREQEKHLRKMVKEKTYELERANEYVKKINIELEHRVEQRTKELSLEAGGRRTAEEKLYYMAFHDVLTNLPNRAWLLRKLEQLIDAQIQAMVQGNKKTFGLMFLDGDRFKQVNDTHGHSMGDQLLVEVAKRLSLALGENQHVIRLGGDEFTILIESVDSAEDLSVHGHRLIELFNKPFQLNQHRVYFKVSTGMVFCDASYRTPESILRDADIAMYRVKCQGKGSCLLFDEPMRDSVIEMAEIEADLYAAIENREFHLAYQPIIDIKTGLLAGFEALLRWEHPRKGNIPPDRFISIAEESGLILPIGLWVIQEACSQLASWRQQFDFSIVPTMAINISSLQLRQPDFVVSLNKIFTQTGINSNLIKLEITESVLMENSHIVNDILSALRSHGIELAIDDFGTGYSSLSYLDKLPVQVLKIDRQFVSAIEENAAEEHKGTLEIIRATISLAHNLNLQVVAEGIETQAQLDYLTQYHCDFGQGYFLSRPMTALNAIKFIEKNLNLTIKKVKIPAASSPLQVNKKHTKRLRLRDMRK